MERNERGRQSEREARARPGLCVLMICFVFMAFARRPRLRRLPSVDPLNEGSHNSSEEFKLTLDSSESEIQS